MGFLLPYLLNLAVFLSISRLKKWENQVFLAKLSNRICSVGRKTVGHGTTIFYFLISNIIWNSQWKNGFMCMVLELLYLVWDGGLYPAHTLLLLYFQIGTVSTILCWKLVPTLLFVLLTIIPSLQKQAKSLFFPPRQSVGMNASASFSAPASTVQKMSSGRPSPVCSHSSLYDSKTVVFLISLAPNL